jgi:predicted ester cyclase
VPDSATPVAIHEIFSKVIDGGDYHETDRYFTPDYIDHSAMGDLHGAEAFSGMLEGFRAAMPGFRHEISDLTFIDNDTALWQVHLTATFAGEFMGVQGGGQRIDLWVANAAKFAADGRVREHWGLARDGLGLLLTQMGLDAAAMASSGAAYSP